MARGADFVLDLGDRTACPEPDGAVSQAPKPNERPTHKTLHYYPSAEHRFAHDGTSASRRASAKMKQKSRRKSPPPMPSPCTSHRPTAPPPAHPRFIRATRKSPQAPYAREWALAHDQFIDCSLALGALQFVEPNHDDKTVLHLRAFRYKTAPGGALEKVAARCTVRGDLMAPSVPFDTAVQSPSYTARRMLYALAAVTNEQIRAVDFPNAYLRAPAHPNHRLTMLQPRLSDGTLTAPATLSSSEALSREAPTGLCI